MSYNSNISYKYKQNHPFEYRREEFEKMKKLYPDRVFIIIEKVQNSDIPQIDKNKFMVPPDLTISKLVYVIRKHCKISSHKALFIFVDNTLPPNSALISEIHNTYADPDGFLYLNYSGEITFG